MAGAEPPLISSQLVIVHVLAMATIPLAADITLQFVTVHVELFVFVIPNPITCFHCYLTVMNVGSS